MALNTKQVGNHTFFELHISCPVCHDNGLNTPRTFWTHHNCGGSLFLGDNANYLCGTCNHMSHVKGWKYGCPSHSKGTTYEFLSTSSVGLAAVLSTAGQMVSETGVAWLQAFLANMGEF